MKGNFEELYPINPIDNGPIEFSFSCSDSDMFDLNDTLLEVRGNVKYSDDSNLVATDTHVTPVKILLYSLFSDVSVHVNKYKIENGNFLHPYETIFLKT